MAEREGETTAVGLRPRRGRRGRWALLLVAAASFAARAESTVETGRGDKAQSGRAESAAAQAELAPANLGLQVKERLVYDIRINGVPAGQSLLEVRRVEGEATGPQVWFIEMLTRSNRAVSWFLYDVHNKVFSKIDVKGGFSRSCSVERNEGDVRVMERIRFTYDIGGMEAVYERLRGDGQWRVCQIPLSGKVLDPVAALYYLRSLDLRNLQPGATVRLPICADRRVWNTEVRVKERKTVERIGYLTGRECVIVEPEAGFRGVFERKGKMRIWLDALTGVPLKMTAAVPIGPAEAVLSEAKSSPLPEKP